MLTLRDLKADTELVAKDFQGFFFTKELTGFGPLEPSRVGTEMDSNLKKGLEILAEKNVHVGTQSFHLFK